MTELTVFSSFSFSRSISFLDCFITTKYSIQIGSCALIFIDGVVQRHPVIVRHILFPTITRPVYILQPADEIL